METPKSESLMEANQHNIADLVELSLEIPK